MDLELRGKKALVCGGSAGMGYAIAEKLSEEGCEVLITSRSRQKLESARDLVTAHTGHSPAIFPANLSEYRDVSALITHAKENFQHLDILVNNTGGPKAGKFLDITEEQWSEDFQSIFMSVVRLVRELVPVMNRGASIINILSRSAKEAIPNLVVSNAFRPALAGLAKTLSWELAEYGIRINNICPGSIRTERLMGMLQARAQDSNSTYEEMVKEAAAGIPLGRIGEPDEVASLVAFLCSKEASYLTGGSYFLDGGSGKTNI